MTTKERNTKMEQGKTTAGEPRTATRLQRLLALPPDREIFESQVPASERESTTFCRDFMMAEVYGVAAIRDTFNRAFAGWKHHYKYLTELTMTLNHRLHYWFHTVGEDDERTKLYSRLWDETFEWGKSNLKGEELNFFLAVLD